MFAAALQGIGRRHKERPRAVLFKYRHAHPDSGVGKESSRFSSHLIEPGIHLLFAQAPHKGQVCTILGEHIATYVPERINGTVFKEIHGKRAADVLLFALFLRDKRRVGGSKGKRLEGVLAGLITLDIRELHHLSGLEVHNGQRILGHFVGLFLGNLGPPRSLEIGLDLAHGVGIVLQHGGLVTAGDFHSAVLFLARNVNVQGSVTLLRVHLIGDDLSGRRDGGMSHGLPAVKHAVVQGFFLGLQRNAQKQAGKKEYLSHFFAGRM